MNFFFAASLDGNDLRRLFIGHNDYYLSGLKLAFTFNVKGPHVWLRTSVAPGGGGRAGFSIREKSGSVKLSLNILTYFVFCSSDERVRRRQI